MYLAYFDECGDDGYPKYSSQLFSLTSIYMHFSKWKENYEKIYKFRTELKKQHSFPMKLEFKAKEFILNKNPYRQFGWDDKTRKAIIDLYVNMTAALDMKVVNVVIDKGKIRDKYVVLENALKYNVQRIENDLASIIHEHKFMIIADEGRIGAMRKIARKIQRLNYIPSLYCHQHYRREIKRLIEDTLPKNSKQSYFIQIVDMIVWLITIYCMDKYSSIAWRKRVANILKLKEVEDWLIILKKVFNLKASRGNKFGIVLYPK